MSEKQIKEHFLDAFEAVVTQYPDNIAVETDGQMKLTYAELKTQALDIARTLKDNGAKAETIVGLHIEKSADYLTAMMGCWYAGAAFMPLDPDLPDERRDFILADSKTDIILTRQDYAANLHGQKVKVIGIENIDRSQEHPMPDIERNTDDLAYVIYTSGSTGTPKGVVVTHRGLVPMLDAQINAFKLDSTSKSLFYLSTNFDASISDIGTALLSGATLNIETRDAQEIAANLTGIVKDRGITYMDIPPSVLRIIDPAEMPDCLQSITIGGETLAPDIARKWAEKIRLINVYGPTEATICTSLVICDAEKWQQTTIGKPLPAVSYKIVDHDMKEVTAGQSGELLIGGIQLARGYLNRPDLNQSKFVDIDGERFYRSSDKVIASTENEPVFVGRIDRQVKIRGQLVELEEVETALLKNPDIAKAAVLKRPAFEGGADSLVAFLSLQDGAQKIDLDTLKSDLGNALSKWMIPPHIDVLDTMPQTITGKINYDILKTRTLQSANAAAKYDRSRALSALENQILDIWKRVLKKGDINIHDNYTDIGGDSLMTIEIDMAAEAEGLSITPNLIYENPTIAQLAKWIEDNPEYKNHATTASAMDADELRIKMKFDEEWQKIIDAAKDLSPAPQKAQHIFVTGATGFLASRLMHEILSHDKDVTISALARAQNPEKGMERIEKALAIHGLKFTPEMKSRITTISGDLASPNLGLDDEEWNALAHKADSIIHSGAIVNMTAPYESLQGANVEGTKTAARLALTGKRKKLHYASTLSVFVSTDQNEGVLLESDKLENTKTVYGGYGQTKWAAEYFLQQIPPAVSDIHIHRLGLITGDTLSGHSSSKDFLSMFVKGIVNLGAVPDADANAIEVDATPVDYCAEAMRHIVLNEDKAYEEHHNVYHIANTRGFSLEQMLNAVRWRGSQIDTLPADTWKSKMDAMQRSGFSVEESAAYFAISRILPDADLIKRHHAMDLFQATGVQFDQTNTQKALKGSNIILPPPDRTLLDRYLDNITGKKKEISKRGARKTMRGKTGLVLGKFMPPHNGHFHLINFAKNYPGVEKLYVIVDRTPDAPIPQSLRVNWLQTQFPDIKVLPLGDYNYQDPGEAPSEQVFWDQWQNSLKEAVPEGIDYCFNSEDYGWKLAEVLGATHVPVDRGRENFPISGTMMRKDPFSHWDQLPKVVRPYFTKKVAVVGPESTGKSTMAINLAKHFNTKVVPEYARLFLEALAEKNEPRSTDLGDIPIFADGQMASEQALIGEANRVLICDTEPLTTKVWSEILYGEVPESVIEHCDEADYDLYILASADVPWVPDTHRQWDDESKQERRIAFQNAMKAELTARGKPFIEITGKDFDDRFNQAKEAIEDRVFRGRVFDDFVM